MVSRGAGAAGVRLTSGGAGVLWLNLRERFLSRVEWLQLQHILESELEGLEEVRGPRPRRELGSTISCHLEGSRGPELCGSLRKAEGQSPAGRSAPRSSSRACSGRPTASVLPRRHTGPCHVSLSVSWRRPSAAGRHVTPTGDLAGLPSEHRGTDRCSITAAGPPWPRALEASAPARSPPGCHASPLPAPRPPSPHSHSRCPARLA